jgi:hypothetical protein
MVWYYTLFVESNCIPLRYPPPRASRMTREPVARGEFVAPQFLLPPAIDFAAQIVFLVW